MENPNPEKLTNLAKSKEKSQAELREALDKRFSGMENIIDQALSEYDNALKDGLFEDKEGEEENAGETRKRIMQDKIDALLDNAEKMKEKLDSKEELAQYTESISIAHINPDNATELISLNLEQKLQEFTDFYKKTKLDLPADFEDLMRAIWENNIDGIQQAIEENGFNDILLMPGNIPLPDLNSKMTEGYAATYESDNFKQGGSFPKAKSKNVDKPRIVLVHKVQNIEDHPELKKTLNIKGQNLNQDHILTLEDYLVFQRKYFEETNKHLDEKGWTWLATESGARLVDAVWDPSAGQVSVFAHDLDDQSGGLGARSSRSFF